MGHDGYTVCIYIYIYMYICIYIFICLFIFRYVLGKPLLGVSFPKPGEYEIAMFCGGTMGT